MTNDMINCAACGMETHQDDIVIPRDFGRGHCFGCIDECGYCGDFFVDIYGHRYYSCDSCGRSICPESDYIECCGDFYCENCGNGCCGRSGRVRSYHDNPPITFYGDGPYFGIEIEFNGDTDAIVDAVHQFDNCEEYVWMCDDGSLNGGAEIISHPMSLEYVQNEFPFGSMLRALQRSGGAYVDDGTGIHVHVDRRAFRRNGKHSQTHAARWMKFIYANKHAVELVARRDSAQWAEFVPFGTDGYHGYSARLVDKSAGYRTTDNRYVAVNTTKSVTYELRMFRSTFDASELLACVELAAATVEFTRSRHVALVDMLTWSTFAAWVTARQSTYPALAAVM